MNANVLVVVSENTDNNANDGSEDNQGYVSVLCDESGRPLYAYPV